MPVTLGALLALLCCATTLPAQYIVLDEGKTEPKAGWLLLPYGFTSETWDVAFGLGGGGTGWPAPYSTTYGAATLSTNQSWNLVVGGVNYPGLLSDRLFIDPYASFADYTNLRVYVPGNPDFLDSPDKAGSNDSSPDNFFREAAHDTWLQANIRYVLPIGDGAEDPVHTYVVDRGMLVSGSSGGTNWNPLESGRTSILARPYYRDQSVTIPVNGNPFPFKTLNLQLSLEYDNRDFQPNPSRGSYQKISFTRDWGQLSETNPWSFGELELGKFFNLGETSIFRQQVLALNAWTGYSFTWNETEIPEVPFPVATERPPYYTGATLGGLFRMRGYPQARFNGRAVSYYSAEYRVIPHWTPFASSEIFEMIELSWWQISLFVEAGRVADSYNLDLLYKDMHYDAGIDLRFFVRHAVVRVGIAGSDESVQVVAMFGQPF